jgi:hypothetical protein
LKFSLFEISISCILRVLQKEEEIEKEKKEPEDNTPKLDLGFKEGQTIKVNLNIAVSFDLYFENYFNLFFNQLFKFLF